MPGVKGVGDKTARDLVAEYGDLEAILAAAPSLTKKRPREALQEHAELARLSKELVTIKEDLPMALSLDEMRVKEPDSARLRQIFVELEFHNLARSMPDTIAPVSVVVLDSALDGVPDVTRRTSNFVTVDTVQALEQMIVRARAAPYIAFDVETVSEPDSPQKSDPLRFEYAAPAAAS